MIFISFLDTFIVALKNKGESKNDRKFLFFKNINYLIILSLSLIAILRISAT